MRLILLLSALLSAFAAGVSPARAVGASVAQVSALASVVSARGAVATAGRRPLVVLPGVREVLRAVGFGEPSPALAVPLYAGRLRT